jgi:hypothetical protein
LVSGQPQEAVALWPVPVGAWPAVVFVVFVGV